MPENVDRCLLCDHPQSQLFDRSIFRGSLVVNRICSFCGLVYQSPRMTEEEQQAFYENEYRRLYQGTEDITPREVYVQKGRASAALEFITNKVNALNRHLDIGSGAGVLLQRVQERFGCDSVGIEPDPIRRGFSQEQGLAVYTSLDELKINNEPVFDLVSLYHVLEHLSCPVEYLVNIRETYLDPSGFLLLEAPNLYAHDSFEIAHLISFSVHTLTQTVKRAGFEVVASAKHGRPRSQTLPLYLIMLARPLSGDAFARVVELQPEKYVAAKRKIGMLRRRVLQKLAPQKAWLPEPG